jgi:hypothetical protein
MLAKKTRSGRMLGMCYILHMTRPSVHVASGVHRSHRGLQGGGAPLSSGFEGSTLEK